MRRRQDQKASLAAVSFGGVAASRWLQKLSIKIRRRVVGGGGWRGRWRALCLTGDFYGSLIKLISCLVWGEGGVYVGGCEQFFCATLGSERSQALVSVCRAKPHHLLEAAQRTGSRIHLVTYQPTKEPNFQKFQTAFYPSSF